MRITVLTDFGTADGYVAEMKGVLASLAPGVPIDDAAQDVPPGDVLAAAWALWRYWRSYPPGTVHLVVVDPGVGTERRALAGSVDDRFLVGPDNGVFTRVLADARETRLVSIEASAAARGPVSTTFHGRDVFAPAAAQLARNGDIDALGPPVEDPVRLSLEAPARTGSGARGTVVHVDRFGNLITDIPGAWLSGSSRVWIAGRDVGPILRTYGDARQGALLAVIGSAGLLEVAARDGSAAALLGVVRGTAVEVRADPTR